MFVSFRSVVLLFVAAACLIALRGTSAEPPAPKAQTDAAPEYTVQDVTDYLPKERALRDAMQQPAAIRAERLPLARVVQQLADAHNVNFVIEEGSLQRAGVKSPMSVPVSLEKGPPLDVALGDMLDDVGLDYEFCNSCIRITSPEDVAKRPEIRVYDVGALLGQKGTAADVATLFAGARSREPLEMKGQGRLLIVRHNRRGHAAILKKLNKITLEQVREVVKERTTISVPGPRPKPRAVT